MQGATRLSLDCGFRHVLSKPHHHQSQRAIVGSVTTIAVATTTPCAIASMRMALHNMTVHWQVRLLIALSRPVAKHSDRRHRERFTAPPLKPIQFF